MIGGGVVHHDIINVPFYGRVYDTAIIAHPLTVSDRLQDSRTRPSHVRMLLDSLETLQEQSRGDPRTSLTEWRARADSIAVLNAISINWRCRVKVSAADAYDDEDEDEDDDGDEAAKDGVEINPAYGGDDTETGQQEFFDTVEFSGPNFGLDACEDNAMEGGVAVF